MADSIQDNGVNIIKKNDKLIVEMPELKEVQTLQIKDPFCLKWIKFLKTGATSNLQKSSINFYKNKLLLNENDILIFKAKRKNFRIVLPECLIGEVLKTAHNLKSGAHLGRERTWRMVENTCYRPGLRKVVNSYVKNCTFCMEKKARNKSGKRVKIVSVE